MANQSQGKKNNKYCIIAVFIVVSLIGLGTYWNYRMNNTMIVKFTLRDDSDPSFPFGERRIDASLWIKQGYKKLDDYQIYNPSPISLEKNFDLIIAIHNVVEDSKFSFPKLYQFFETKGAYEEFLKKDIRIQYVASYFNEYTNTPIDDRFLVRFDEYQIYIIRRFKGKNVYLSGTDLMKNNQSP